MMVCVADWRPSSLMSCLKVLKPEAPYVTVSLQDGSSAKEKLPSASVLNVRVIPFSGLLIVTVAPATRAPEESETKPENIAVEAAVWACATGTAMLIATAAMATDRCRERLRNLGID